MWIGRADPDLSSLGKVSWTSAGLCCVELLSRGWALGHQQELPDNELPHYLQTVTALNHHLPPHLSPGTSPYHAALSLLPAYCTCILLGEGGQGGNGVGGQRRCSEQRPRLCTSSRRAGVVCLFQKSSSRLQDSLKGTQWQASLVSWLRFLFLPKLRFCPGHQGQGRKSLCPSSPAAVGPAPPMVPGVRKGLRKSHSRLGGVCPPSHREARMLAVQPPSVAMRTGAGGGGVHCGQLGAPAPAGMPGWMPLGSQEETRFLVHSLSLVLFPTATCSYQRARGESKSEVRALFLRCIPWRKCRQDS